MMKRASAHARSLRHARQNVLRIFPSHILPGLTENIYLQVLLKIIKVFTRMKIRFTVYSLLYTVCAFAQLQQGQWRMELKLNDSTQLPFRFEVVDKTIEIINADE